MLNGTTHMGGNATGAARLGADCPAVPAVQYVGTTLPSIAGSWHATDLPMGKQVSPVFTTDRPARRPLERFP
jgi:hypothetical protein